MDVFILAFALGALFGAAIPKMLSGMRKPANVAPPAHLSTAWSEEGVWWVFFGPRKAFSQYGHVWSWEDTGETVHINLSTRMSAKAQQAKALTKMGRKPSRPAMPTSNPGAISEAPTGAP